MKTILWSIPGILILGASLAHAEGSSGKGGGFQDYNGKKILRAAIAELKTFVPKVEMPDDRRSMLRDALNTPELILIRSQEVRNREGQPLVMDYDREHHTITALKQFFEGFQTRSEDDQSRRDAERLILHEASHLWGTDDSQADQFADDFFAAVHNSATKLIHTTWVPTLEPENKPEARPENIPSSACPGLRQTAEKDWDPTTHTSLSEQQNYREKLQSLRGNQAEREATWSQCFTPLQRNVLAYLGSLSSAEWGIINAFQGGASDIDPAVVQTAQQTLNEAFLRILRSGSFYHHGTGFMGLSVGYDDTFTEFGVHPMTIPPSEASTTEPVEITGSGVFLSIIAHVTPRGSLGYGAQCGVYEKLRGDYRTDSDTARNDIAQNYWNSSPNPVPPHVYNDVADFDIHRGGVPASCFGQ